MTHQVGSRQAWSPGPAASIRLRSTDAGTQLITRGEDHPLRRRVSYGPIHLAVFRLSSWLIST